ncbi:MAG: hypothetical protein JNM56_13075 [Planctomycetia bacterium]|nr:hypothetical protein [Planctomycetia bacterium]
MDSIMRAIELTGSVDEQQRRHLDAPVPITGPSRVRVLILVADSKNAPGCGARRRIQPSTS